MGVILQPKAERPQKLLALNGTQNRRWPKDNSTGVLVADRDAFLEALVAPVDELSTVP